MLDGNFGRHGAVSSETTAYGDTVPSRRGGSRAVIQVFGARALRRRHSCRQPPRLLSVTAVGRSYVAGTAAKPLGYGAVWLKAAAFGKGPATGNYTERTSPKAGGGRRGGDAPRLCAAGLVGLHGRGCRWPASNFETVCAQTAAKACSACSYELEPNQDTRKDR